MDKEIRWKQRFQNLKKAFSQLQRGLNIAKPNDIELQGIIQSFEFTFELSWKTLKDFLKNKGVDVSFPRDVIKEAFHHQIIDNGEIWLDMLENRNLIAHTYDEKRAIEVISLIREKYEPAVTRVVAFLDKEKNK